jgi:Na+-translocating ferredoxin:NAD+ oxidoreductase RNF subunit RnfB
MTNIEWSKDLHHIDILTLDKDISKAMEKLEKMNQIIEELPGLDCGACGSPSCKSLAEDIVRGYANITDCIFILRKRVRELANEMMELEAKMPPVMDK